MKNKKIVLAVSIIVVAIIIIAILILVFNKNNRDNIEDLNNLNSEALLENELNILNELALENEISLENEVLTNQVNISDNEENQINYENEINEENSETSNKDNEPNSSSNNGNSSSNNSDNNDANDSGNKNNTESIVYPTYQKLSYGSSENGRDLVYYSIAPDNYTSTLLMVFAIHGYEDGYAKDGQLLVDTAEYLKEYYQNKSQAEMYNTRILIVPCANPDGLYEGTTNNGFGRCNAKGIDLNRDFDALHKVFNSARNYTQYPFSAKESQALRDLIYAENPDAVLDLHGWENCTIGDGKLADVFKTYVGLNHKTEFNSNCNGYLSYWAHLQGADSLLVEFRNTSIPKESVAKAINKILEII